MYGKIPSINPSITFTYNICDSPSTITLLPETQLSTQNKRRLI